jgi:uncharacterized protein YbjT (DUF2867 family)
VRASYPHERLRKRHCEMTLVTAFGGTGFLCHHILEALAREGTTVRVAVRQPWRSGQRALASVAVAGAEGIVNAVSTYVERGGVTLQGRPLARRRQPASPY